MEASAIARPRFRSAAGRARYEAAYETALATWPVPLERRRVETRLGPTHVVASGDASAPPLVLLPSFAGTATAWRPNVAALARHFRVYAVDVIGQPGLSLATRRPRDRGDYAGWLTDVLDGLGVARASVVGCSFGAFLALSQASLTPERVERVVLISPAGTFVPFSWRIAARMLTAHLRRRVRALLGDRRPPRYAEMSAVRAPLHEADAPWRALMDVTMDESPSAYTIVAGVLPEAEVRAVSAPTLLLVGELEILYDPHDAVRIARTRMPALEAEVVPGADHMAAMARPDEVNARIVRFLRWNASPSPALDTAPTAVQAHA